MCVCDRESDECMDVDTTPAQPPCSFIHIGFSSLCSWSSLCSRSSLSSRQSLHWQFARLPELDALSEATYDRGMVRVVVSFFVLLLGALCVRAHRASLDTQLDFADGGQLLSTDTQALLKKGVPFWARLFTGLFSSPPPPSKK